MSVYRCHKKLFDVLIRGKFLYKSILQKDGEVEKGVVVCEVRCGRLILLAVLSV